MTIWQRITLIWSMIVDVSFIFHFLNNLKVYFMNVLYYSIILNKLLIKFQLRYTIFYKDIGEITAEDVENLKNSDVLTVRFFGF